MSDVTTSRSNPVRVASATLAALQCIVAGSALTDIVGLKVAGMLGLMVAAAQLGLGEYVRGQVTPWSDVVAKRAQDGTAVAGPASQAPTGTEVVEPAPVEPPPVEPPPEVEVAVDEPPAEVSAETEEVEAPSPPAPRPRRRPPA